MKIFKYIVLLLVLVIIGLSVFISMQPNSFNVSRTRTIKAPLALVYNTVIDFKSWKDWSSWVEKDPSIVITLPDTTKGVGSFYTWKDKYGQGKMTTISTDGQTAITQKMEFEGFPPSHVTWKLLPDGNGNTTTTWQIEGKDLPFKFKAFSLFTSGMEKQIGPHYERSLEKLDSIISARMKVHNIAINGVTQLSGGFYIYNSMSCKTEDMDKHVGNMMAILKAYAAKYNVSVSGVPFIYYHKWDEANNAAMFSCCLPTLDKVTTQVPDILTGQLPQFKALKTTLEGDYVYLKNAWEQGIAYAAENGLEVDEKGPMLEVYKTDPAVLPNPANWLTELYIALQ